MVRRVPQWRGGVADAARRQSARDRAPAPIGQAMPAVLINPESIHGCTLKVLIESADRTREASQLEPLLRMIRDAKSASENR
jgi:hypothetical protein